MTQLHSSQLIKHMITKESRELYLAERFLPELFKEQHYTVSQPTPPLSDVIINVGERKIGIEMTALISDEFTRRQESDQDSILREAQILFEKKYHLPLQVSITFAETANWGKLNRNQIANFIATTVINSVLKINNLAQYPSTFDIKIDNIENPYIYTIDIFYSQPLTIPCWTALTSCWVPSLPIEKIKEIINRKNKNVSGYLKDCDEVWLLILEIGSPSSPFDNCNKLQKVTFHSSFARTLLGRISKGELITIQ